MESGRGERFNPVINSDDMDRIRQEIHYLRMADKLEKDWKDIKRNWRSRERHNAELSRR